MLKLSPKKNGIPSFSVENFINKGDEPSVPGTKVYRWSLHANWVSSIKYCGKLRVFISTSNDPNTSLVMGNYAINIHNYITCVCYDNRYT
jgi:hypothetical protein